MLKLAKRAGTASTRNGTLCVYLPKLGCNTHKPIPVEPSIWLGIRCGWFPRTRIRHSGQCYCRHIHKRHVRGMYCIVGPASGGGGPTTRKDKLNDNILLSCCCARVGPTWTTVCPCYEGSKKYDQSCLKKSLVAESLFYAVGIVRLFHQSESSALH